MLKYSQYSLIASLMLVVLALACYVLVLTLKKSVHQAPALVHAGVGARGAADDDDLVDADGSTTVAPAVTSRPRALALYGTHFTRLALVFLTACLVFRTIAVGHGPFSNQYEFLSLIHISEPTRRTPISYAVFCLKKKTTTHSQK